MFNRGDLEGFLRAADPEIEWHDRPEVGGRIYHGAQATVEHLRSALRDLPGYHVDVQDLVDAGASVVACGRVSAQGRAGEAPVDRPFFAVYAIHAGRIRSVRIFGDRVEALHAAEGLGNGGRLRAWYAALSKGAKVLVAAVVAAGAIASAIGAILALWPDPPAELGGDLSRVEIDRGITLEEFTQHQPSETALRSSGDASPRLIANIVVQAEPEDEIVPQEGATGAPDIGDIVLRPELSEEDNALLQEGASLAVNETQIEISRPCEIALGTSDCGISPTVPLVTRDGLGDEATAEEVGTRLAALLADTQTVLRPGTDQLQPLGVAVNFNISLTGFQGETVDVRWSMYRASGGRPLQPFWARGQRVLWLEGEADTDSGSDDFWVPVPKFKGSFFVRVSAHDEDGDRLDYEDTETFDSGL